MRPEEVHAGAAEGWGAEILTAAAMGLQELGVH